MISVLWEQSYCGDKPVRQQGVLFISTASSRGDAMLNDVLHGVAKPVDLL